MSEETKFSIKAWLSENIVVAILGAIMVAIGWANNSQLNAIALKQDKAILQSQADANERFVTKTWFNSEDVSLRNADTANSAALTAVAVSVADIKTDVAVIKAEVQRQGNHN